MPRPGPCRATAGLSVRPPGRCARPRSNSQGGETGPPPGELSSFGSEVGPIVFLRSHGRAITHRPSASALVSLWRSRSATQSHLGLCPTQRDGSEYSRSRRWTLLRSQASRPLGPEIAMRPSCGVPRRGGRSRRSLESTGRLGDARHERPDDGAGRVGRARRSAEPESPDWCPPQACGRGLVSLGWRSRRPELGLELPLV